MVFCVFYLLWFLCVLFVVGCFLFCFVLLLLFVCFLGVFLKVFFRFFASFVYVCVDWIVNQLNILYCYFQLFGIILTLSARAVMNEVSILAANTLLTVALFVGGVMAGNKHSYFVISF